MVNNQFFRPNGNEAECDAFAVGPILMIHVNFGALKWSKVVYSNKIYFLAAPVITSCSHIFIISASLPLTITML